MILPVIAALSHWVAALSHEASDAEDWDRVDYWDGFGLGLIGLAVVEGRE